MSTPLTEAEQAARQARIQEDIRRLFDRYRRTGPRVTPYVAPPQQAVSPRFRRDDATASRSRPG